ncbi:MAG TPA: hypothetical protein VJU86_16965 [Pyrinomonadaceae bacterium]|nr:hypothetical protein [Pyrinomonadaceae bacterium]
MEATLDANRLRLGERLSVSFQRTLRLPDDGRTYPLPPGLGAFPVRRVADFADRVPATWRERDGFFIPMYQREALWLGFTAAAWKPNVVKVGVGRVNAVSGDPWNEKLHDDPQDYVVCPNQPWLDGINAGEGYIRQFVAMPLGLGYTVEGQLTGSEEFGGIQLLAYEPKPGRFPDQAPPTESSPTGMPLRLSAPMTGPSAEMGLAVGGRMKQKIYPDPYGCETWDEQNLTRAFVHIVNSEQYEAITGEKTPLTPVSAETYTRHGLPWFDLYDEHAGDLKAAKRLRRVKSINERDEEGGTSLEEESLGDVPDSQIKKLRHGRSVDN